MSRSLDKWLTSHPQLNLLIGFLGYTVVGAVLLSLPWFHARSLSWIDTVFTAVSAVSTTGLVVVSTVDSYNLAGQILILILFQVGGLGYLTLVTYVVLATTDKIKGWHKRVIGSEFELPKEIRIRDFIRHVVYFTIIMEVAGTIILTWEFYELGTPIFKAAWYGIFHSVSAFCTAGFHLFDDSLIGFQNNYVVSMTTMTLSLAGALGFAVVSEIFYWIRRRTERISVTSRAIILGILTLGITGATLIYLTEDLVQVDASESILQSAYLSSTALSTVGFTTVEVDALGSSTLILVCALMFVGASPSGTSGGVRITTVSALFALLYNRLMGRDRCTLMGRLIPSRQIYLATSTFTLYSTLLFLGILGLGFSEQSIEILPLIFEAFSAIGTVGLSMGATSTLSDIGKVIIMILMFFGRVGLVFFGFSLLTRSE
jgi:trk system potassium uptake protein TrkH